MFNSVKMLNFYNRRVINIAWLIVICVSGFGIHPAFATHIVGGQLSYTCLGNNKYAITLTVRRDCINGADTVYFDNPAEVGIFNAIDKSLAWRVEDNGKVNLEFFKDDTLPEKPAEICLQGNLVCVHQATYRKIITLPYSEQGYIIAYQRCCRNVTLSNIELPLETGTTYALYISPSDLVNCNSGPQYGPFPPIYTCVDKPFVFDHSAIDLDGDSLVYSLCLPNIGRTRLDPKGIPTFPPYDSVVLKSVYSLNSLLNPNGSGTALKINPVTGVMTAVPNTIGQFLVGVCITEYRHGIKMSSQVRDFELNVVPCGVQPMASFDVLTGICDGWNQKFRNLSKDATRYTWYFDYPNNLNANSADVDANYNYSRNGIYNVVLVARNGSCTDTFKRILNVINGGLKADFKIMADCYPDIRVHTLNRSTTLTKIVSYDWSLFNNNVNLTSSEFEPAFNVSGYGKYKIRLIVTDSLGCRDTLEEPLDLSGINVDLIDGGSICRGDSIHLVKNRNSAYFYTWIPAGSLNLKDPSDPVAHPDTTTTYKVTITDNTCTLTDSVKINVRQKFTYQIIGDSSSCDGHFEFMAMSDSTRMFEWSLNEFFNPVEFTGEKFIFNTKENKVVYVRAGNKDQCADVTKIQLRYNGIDLNYSRKYSLCSDEPFDLKVINLDPKDTLKIKWKPDSVILSGQGTLSPKVNLMRPGVTKLYMMVTNQFGCMLSDSIEIEAIPIIVPDIMIETTCGSRSIVVKTNYSGKIKWDFGDGKGTSTRAVDNYTYSTDGKFKVTLKADTLCGREVMQTIEIVFNDVHLKDSIVACDYDTVYLNPSGNPMFKYKWYPDSILIDPDSPNPHPKYNKDAKYYVEFFNPANPGCVFKDTVCVFYIRNYFLNPLVSDSSLCLPGTVTLRVLTNMDIAWCDIQGKLVGSGDTLKVNLDRDSVFVIKGLYKGCRDIDTVNLNLVEFNSEISGPDILCPGDTAVLKVVPSDTNWMFSWTPKASIIGSDHLDSVRFFVNEKTTFGVEVKDSFGCMRNLSRTVDVSVLSKIIFATAEPSIVTAGEKVQLKTIFGAGYKYQWAPNDGSLNAIDIYNPIAMPTNTTSYTVTVTDENGCTATASVLVTVIPCDESVFIPSAFSPNNDKVNDIFYVRSSSLTQIDLIIYDRWGEQVFHTDKLNEGWDGIFKGALLGPDVFAYYVKFHCLDSKEYSKKGNVTLLK